MDEIAPTGLGPSKDGIFPAVALSIDESGSDDDEVVFARPEPSKDSVFLIVFIEEPGSGADGSVFVEADSAKETTLIIEEIGSDVHWAPIALQV